MRILKNIEKEFKENSVKKNLIKLLIELVFKIGKKKSKLEKYGNYHVWMMNSMKIMILLKKKMRLEKKTCQKLENLELV